MFVEVFFVGDLIQFLLVFFFEVEFRCLSEIVTIFMEDVFRVVYDDIAGFAIGVDQEVCDSDVGCIGIEYGDLHFVQFFFDYFGGVDEFCYCYECRFLLIVMLYGDPYLLPQLFEDVEALRFLYVFEVDFFEGGLKPFDGEDQFFFVFDIEVDGECIDAVEVFEEDRLFFHHWQRCLWLDFVEPEHARIVGDYGDEIVFVGVFEYCFGFFVNFLTRFSDIGRVLDTEVVEVAQIVFQRYFYLVDIIWVQYYCILVGFVGFFQQLLLGKFFRVYWIIF